MTDFIEKHTPGSEICVAAFASGADEFSPGMPIFDFGFTIGKMKVSYILLRDSTGLWFRNGVPGIGDREQTIDYLRATMTGYKRRVTIGLSAGSFGALLYGQLIPVDEIIAISPVTVLGGDAEREFAPHWAHRVRLPPNVPPIDLRPHFEKGPIPVVNAYVSDGDGAELDQRMCDLIGVMPTLISGYTHAGLGAHMTGNGMIRQLIAGEI